MADPTPPPCTIVDTFGWDTAYALRFPTVNASIVKKGSSPTTFSKSVTDDDGTTTINGNFSAWQLTTGGSSVNLFMNLPIPSGTLTFLNATDNLTNLVATAQINLMWLSTGNVQNLTPSNNVDSVFISNIDYGGSSITQPRRSIFRNMLEAWLKENVGLFQHTFAQLTIDEAGDQGAFAWLKPTGNPSYAVADAGAGNDITQSVFGVLCMTEGRPAPGSNMISTDAIPSGVNSGLLIHPRRVLEKMFLPGMPILFQNATASSFTISTDGKKITNTADLNFPQQDVGGGKMVNPVVAAGNFNLSFEGCEVLLQVDQMTFEWSSGINVSVNHKTYAAIGITSSGQFNITVRRGSSNATVESSDGMLIGEIVGAIAGAIIAGLAGGFLGSTAEGGEVAMNPFAQQAAINDIEMQAQGGANALGGAADGVVQAAADQTGVFARMWATTWVRIVVSAVAGGIIGAIPATIIEILKKVAQNQGADLPGWNAFGTQALSPIAWPDTTPEGFNVKTAELAGALRIGVDYQ